MLCPLMAFAQKVDADKQLKYCHTQVNKALKALKANNDYTMMPRNILNGDKGNTWNCRKSCPEEWLSLIHI